MNNKTLIVVIAVLLLVVGAGAAYIFVLKGNEDKKVIEISSSTSEKTGSAKKINPDLDEVASKVKSHFSTVTETKVYTEDNDPNKDLGKKGKYQSGMAFIDSRTEFEKDSEEPERWGTDAGGSVEVYASVDEAKARYDELAAYQGQSFLDPGALKIKDNVVIRASTHLSKTQQDEILNYIASIL